jgi:hypothetical protein
MYVEDARLLVQYGWNVSTTPITAMGCRQCLPLTIVQLNDKHCRKPHCRNWVVDTFRLRLELISELAFPFDFLLPFDSAQLSMMLSLIY